WSTGLVRPSRSTRGSIAFWTVSDAGYCRAPLPAAVMTALVICTSPLRPRPIASRLHYRHGDGADNPADLSALAPLLIVAWEARARLGDSGPSCRRCW